MLDDPNAARGGDVVDFDDGVSQGRFFAAFVAIVNIITKITTTAATTTTTTTITRSRSVLGNVDPAVLAVSTTVAIAIAIAVAVTAARGPASKDSAHIHVAPLETMAQNACLLQLVLKKVEYRRDQL